MQTIDVPPEVYDALNIPEHQRDDVLRRELAVALYREGILSFGKARELTDLSHKEFHKLLGEREIERHYTEAELTEDIEYARG
jgi:predicted HTH domain antitoxin